ncbi:cation-transporting ATPase [Mycobacterium sp. GA-1841]|nr:cation-transporting ATPase [Mycobacterium sp. GA-1841]
MSCGACSRRVENKLNKIDGVQASVDIATKIATVDARHDVTVADLCAAVEEAGYHAAEHTGAPVAAEASQKPSSRKPPSTAARVLRRLSFGHLGG